MSRETDRAAFLRKIVDEPDQDAHRLVYADWLEEHAERVDEVCPKCGGPEYRGLRCHRCHRKIKDTHDHHSGENYDGTWFCARHDSCPTCSGADTVATYPDRDRAEFIRVQDELEKKLHCKTTVNYPPDYICDRAKLWDCMRCLSMSRERELLAKHRAAWSKWACPECGGDDRADCRTCGGTGDLFHGLTVEFRRGFPHRVTAPTLSVWVRQEEREVDQTSGGTHTFRSWHPTSRLVAVARHTTCAEVLAADREPYHNGGGYCWFDVNRGQASGTAPDAANLPTPIFKMLTPHPEGRGVVRWRDYPTPALASAALARALWILSRTE